MDSKEMLRAMNRIHTNDIIELKAVKNANFMTRLIFDCIQILFQGPMVSINKGAIKEYIISR